MRPGRHIQRGDVHVVVHQVPVPEKRAALAATFHALVPGGRLVLADYGKQKNRLIQLLFWHTVQRIDGKADRQPNADGILSQLLLEAGFEDVAEAATIPTLIGAIVVFTARKRGGRS